jgi:DNA-binding transcriptional LysR family regulator
MDTIRAMRYFVRAVELGSLSAVAREDGTGQSHVSKVLRALEQTLGVRLFERSTTGLAPTEQGQRFHARARLVLEEFEQAVADAQGATKQPAGLLRINAPVAFGQLRMNAIVQQFLIDFPQVQVELILDDRFVDLVEEGVDVALRLGSVLPPTAVARPLGTSVRVLVAAPAYVQRHGTPDAPEALAQHDYVRFAWAPQGDLVTLMSGARTVTVTTRGRFRVNHAIAIRDSLAAGAGIGLCPAWLVDDLLAAGQLVPVLPGWYGAAQQLTLLTPSRRYRPARVTAFMACVARSVAEMPGVTGPGSMPT